jgi:hypothetical protein
MQMYVMSGGVTCTPEHIQPTGQDSTQVIVHTLPAALSTQKPLSQSALVAHGVVGIGGSSSIASVLVSLPESRVGSKSVAGSSLSF